MNPVDSGSGQHAERVAIEVRQVGIIDDEAISPMRKRISRIELEGSVEQVVRVHRLATRYMRGEDTTFFQLREGRIVEA